VSGPAAPPPALSASAAAVSSASLAPFEPPHDCEHRLDVSGPVVISPDSKRLAVGNETSAIFLLDPGTGALRVLVGESPRTRALLFSSDGASLVSVADPTTGAGDVYVWDLAGGAIRSRGSTFCFQKAILAPDNSWVATIGCHGGFEVLETAAGGKSWSATRPPMRSAAASDISLFLRPGDPALILSDSDGTLEMWAPRPLRRLRRVPTSGRNRSPDNAAAQVTFSPDGASFVLADLAGGLSIRDGKTGALLRTLRAAPGSHQETSPWGAVSTGLDFDVAFRADAQVIAIAAAGGEITLWDAKKGSLKHRLEAPSTPPARSSAVLFANRGHLLVSTRDTSSDLWDSRTGQRVASLPDLGVLAWSPDDSRIAWHRSPGLVITDGDTGAILHQLPGESLLFRGWSPDGRFLVATQDESIVLFRVSDGALLRLVLLGPADRPTLLAANADGSRTLDGRAISCLGESPPGRPPPEAAPDLLADFLAGRLAWARLWGLGDRCW
jgi:WD40 repeat protein